MAIRFSDATNGFFQIGKETTYRIESTNYGNPIPLPDGATSPDEHADDVARSVLAGRGEGAMYKLRNRSEGGLTIAWDYDVMGRFLHGIMGTSESDAEGSTGLFENYESAANELPSFSIKKTIGDTLFKYIGFVFDMVKISYSGGNLMELEFNGHSDPPILTSIGSNPAFLAFEPAFHKRFTTFQIMGFDLKDLCESFDLTIGRSLDTDRWSVGSQRAKPVPNGPLTVALSLAAKWDDAIYGGGTSGTGYLGLWRALSAAQTISPSTIDHDNGGSGIAQRSCRFYLPSTRCTGVRIDPRSRGSANNATADFRGLDADLPAAVLGAQGSGVSAARTNSPIGIRNTSQEQHSTF